MGYQLSRKGKEYQRRYVSTVENVYLSDLSPHSCTFRADPMHKGDKVVPPASFSAAQPPDHEMIPDELPTVGDEVLEEVCHNSTW
jgi:hypothetical protein